MARLCARGAIPKRKILAEETLELFHQAIDGLPSMGVEDEGEE